MMGWSPECYIPSYVEIGPRVPEKKIFEVFLPYMGVVAISRQSEETKKNSVGIFEYILASMLKVFLNM